MILFLADGRLGNQIFQYAFLKTIAKENEHIFCLNMKSFFETLEYNSKNIFNINNRYIISIFRKIIIPFFVRPLSTFHFFGYIEQKKNEYNRPLPDYIYQKGILPFCFVNIDFFQSELFFRDSNFFSEIRLKDKYILNASKFLSEIPSDFTKVFIHVRRGDYTNEIFMGTRGIDLPKTYFEKGISIIKNQIKNPFFVFLSDDPSYVECCFETVHPKVISMNSMETDLAIMSLCNAGIISNSSFSWWGAALMKEKAIVIAPKYWFGWKQKIESHPDIYPSGAYLIDVNTP